MKTNPVTLVLGGLGIFILFQAIKKDGLPIPSLSDSNIVTFKDKIESEIAASQTMAAGETVPSLYGIFGDIRSGINRWLTKRNFEKEKEQFAKSGWEGVDPDVYFEA